MQSLYDYKKFAVLYVDDEEMALKYCARALEKDFRILTALNAEDGLKILHERAGEIAIIISDQRMPGGMQGVELLERARQAHPRILRILATAYTDLDAAIHAINNGAIYKYIAKPWEVAHLYATVRRAMEFFLLQREREELLKEKLSVLHNMMITDRVVSLGVLAAGLGHHLRNALVAIRTFLDLAPTKLQEEQVDLEQLRNPDFWRDFYRHVQGHIKKVTEMLGDLVFATTPEEKPFQNCVQVPEVLQKVVEKLSPHFAAKQLRVDCQFTSPLPNLTSDGLKFHRIFELLLMGEIASLPDGAQLSIAARTVPGAGNESEVQVEIADNGPGLPNDALRALFDPFFVPTVPPQEFGIHLMTCYFLVYHHGGRIEVKSRVDGGTVFLLTFPLRAQTGHALLEEKEFLSKVLLNETLWERLLAGN